MVCVKDIFMQETFVILKSFYSMLHTDFLGLPKVSDGKTKRTKKMKNELIPSDHSQIQDTRSIFILFPSDSPTQEPIVHNSLFYYGASVQINSIDARKL